MSDMPGIVKYYVKNKIKINILTTSKSNFYISNR